MLRSASSMPRSWQLLFSLHFPISNLRTLEALAASTGTPADATEESPRPAERATQAAEQQQQQEPPKKSTYWLFQPVYKPEYVESIQPKHQPPETVGADQ